MNCTSPLQKARRALHLALQKAAQDLYDSSNTNYTIYDDVRDSSFVVKNDVELDWPKIENIDEENVTENELTQPDPLTVVKDENTIAEYGTVSQDNLTSFIDEACPQNNNFPQQFLSMPDLDEPNEETSGVELLAEFNIGSEIDQGIIIKSSKKDTECNSLNCVLPSVSNEHNMDDISMLEKNNEDMNHYNSEWDQMFNDMMSNKSCSQEGVSNLRELYSQISQTIDLLNS